MILCKILVFCSTILLDAGASRRGEFRSGAADAEERGLRGGGGLLGEHDVPRAGRRSDVSQRRDRPGQGRYHQVAAQHPDRQPGGEHVALQQVYDYIMYYTITCIPMHTLFLQFFSLYQNHFSNLLLHEEQGQLRNLYSARSIQSTYD